MSNIVELETRHTSGIYPKRSLTIVRGEGARLWDDNGREYIDCVGGQGAANLGHAHPVVVTAISEQASSLISCPEIFYNDRRAEFLAALTAKTPGLDRAFLCNSGTEAVEAAIKFARLSTGRTEIVAAMRAFHGRTFGALSATWGKKYRKGVEPLVPGFRHIPFNNLEALAEAIGDNTAAVLLEPVQGEGGVRPATIEFLQGAQALCRETGALLILDEIQTGYGRTGHFFAHEHFDVLPDLMPIAKSMAGGFPMGACLIGERVGELPKMSHGSTFGGNPLAAAAALATLQVVEGEQLTERAERLGSRLLSELRSLSSLQIREVRGLGLMVGIDLKVRVTPILQSLQDRGILALPAGPTVLRLLPPLVISESDLERVISTISNLLSD